MYGNKASYYENIKGQNTRSDYKEWFCHNQYEASRKLTIGYNFVRHFLLSKQFFNR